MYIGTRLPPRNAKTKETPMISPSAWESVFALLATSMVIAAAASTCAVQSANTASGSPQVDPNSSTEEAQTAQTLTSASRKPTTPLPTIGIHGRMGAARIRLSVPRLRSVSRLLTEVPTTKKAKSAAMPEP
ncbi:hypothetical protein GCM10018952_10410 [Streptosporangium vulgare]